MKKIILGSLSLIFLNSVTVLSAQIATNKLIAHYHFDNNALDTSGNSYHGTVNGAVAIEDRYNHAEMAYYFGGSGYINMGDVANLDTSDFTVSTWFKADLFPTYPGSKIINKGLSSLGTPSRSGFALRCIQENGVKKIKFLMSDGTNYSVEYPNAKANQWYHVAAVRRGSLLTLYVDGQNVSEINTDDETLNINTNLHLIFGAFHGSIGGNKGEYFYGAIDDSRIYKLALNDAQIDSIYNDKSYNSVENLENNKMQVTVYPNPSGKFVHLSLDQAKLDKDYIVEIYSNNGQLQLSATLIQDNKIDISCLDRGTYILHVTDSNGVVQAVSQLIKRQ